jgi:hypothetical protein
MHPSEGETSNFADCGETGMFGSQRLQSKNSFREMLDKIEPGHGPAERRKDVQRLGEVEILPQAETIQGVIAQAN